MGVGVGAGRGRLRVSCGLVAAGGVGVLEKRSVDC